MKSNSSKPKRSYRVGNWPAYNAALINRGDLTIWVDDASLEFWRASGPTGQCGAPRVYSDFAIECMAMLKAVYGLPLRATQGLLNSVLNLLDVGLPVPDYTTLSRRLQSLSVSLPRQASAQPLHLVVDSTGVKLYGDGEWHARRHGPSKRRTWRKLHLGVDEATGDVAAASVSTNDFGDSELLPDILDAIDDEISQVSGDGAYDGHRCYEAIAARGANATIPPRRGARMGQYDDDDEPLSDRDENIRFIGQYGRARWKEATHYHRRSLAETAMFRMKTLFGGAIKARRFAAQSSELFIRCAALNRMTHLGMPDSYAI